MFVYVLGFGDVSLKSFMFSCSGLLTCEHLSSSGSGLVVSLRTLMFFDEFVGDD